MLFLGTMVSDPSHPDQQLEKRRIKKPSWRMGLCRCVVWEWYFCKWNACTASRVYITHTHFKTRNTLEGLSASFWKTPQQRKPSMHSLRSAELLEAMPVWTLQTHDLYWFHLNKKGLMNDGCCSNGKHVIYCWKGVSRGGCSPWNNTVTVVSNIWNLIL